MPSRSDVNGPHPSLRSALKRYVPNSLIRLRRHLLHGRRIANWREGRKLRQLREQQVNSLSMSQVGQDYWVYGEVFNEKRNGYFVDVGAHDGILLSNTFLLEQRYEWNGLLIEANDQTFRSLCNNRTSKCVNVCVDSKQRTVEFLEASVMGGIVAPDCDNRNIPNHKAKKKRTDTLQGVLARFGAPSVIDYLSIDIEGAEDRALLEFAFNEYRFNCMTIERPSSKLRQKLISNKYRLIKEIPGLDCFYVHEAFLTDYHENMMAFGEKSLVYRPWKTAKHK